MSADPCPVSLVASDRAVTADLVLGLAVKEVAQRLAALQHTSVEYRVARADWLLLPAARSAERILGRS